jgi:HAE1 family hydrophobic/amphiphilic exporter-1
MKSAFASAMTSVFLTLVTALAGAAQSDKPQAPQRIGIHGEKTLSLPDAIGMALANNKDIESALIDTQVARFSFTAAKGAFDPKFSVQTPYIRSITPMGSVLAGAADGKLLEKDFSAVPQLNGIVPWTGTSFSLGFSSKRSVTNNSFATLNPQYPSSFTIAVTQPLRRGFRFDSNRQYVEVARKNVALSDEQFRQSVSDIVTQAAKNYWDLVYAIQNQEVQGMAAETARRQVESNRRMMEQGVMAPIDLVEAETQLAQFEQNVYAAQASLTAAENSLKSMILPDRTSPLWANALIPITEPKAPPAEELLDDLVNEAIASRPELAQLKIQSEVNQTNLRYYREQMKPQLDLVGSYMSSGLAGVVSTSSAPNPFTAGFSAMIDRINQLAALQNLPPVDMSALGALGGSGVPEALVGGYGHSLSNLYGFGFPTVQVSLQFSLPLRNRTAEGNMAAGLAEVHRTDIRCKQMEQQIQADVRNAMQSLASYKMALEAARTARRSAQEQYASEQRKFNAGTSTLFLVLQRQTTLVTTQSSELRAQTDLAKATADFERAVGRTLKANNVVLRDVQQR